MHFGCAWFAWGQNVSTAQLHRLLDWASKALVADYFTVLHYHSPTQE